MNKQVNSGALGKRRMLEILDIRYSNRQKVELYPFAFFANNASNQN
jgi:hypothetical protein